MDFKTAREYKVYREEGLPRIFLEGKWFLLSLHHHKATLVHTAERSFIGLM